MNKTFFYFLTTISLLFSNVDLYWDLGLAITKFPIQSKQDDLLTLSTFNRIEGLKKYYSHDFEGSIYYFKQLDAIQQEYILYEYAHAYYQLNKFQEAISLLHNYKNQLLTENLIYLKSKILTRLQDYEAALSNLELLQQDFPNSDYLRIIQFEVEKIHLLNQ